MNLNEVGNSVLDLAKEVGEFIIEQGKIFTSDKIEEKGPQDFVSYVDKEAESMLVKGLKEIIPESGFIVEENSASNANEDYIWIVDPLDGTTNFIHNLAPHAISIALQKNKKTVLGVIYELGHKELFYSWDGLPVYLNTKEISVTKSTLISEGLFATGFSNSDHSRLTGHLKVVKKIIENSHGLRRHGSAATDLAYVAAGIFDGFFEYGLSVWDIAAGAYLVERAGGKVSDYSGKDNYFFGREMLAGNKQIHAELLNILKENM
ncbi:MAG: inositol monophosphatase [Salinivirgaceae bacterium]|nr:inositol monophosphatase [Salinivirgaceae bacterium]